MVVQYAVEPLGSMVVERPSAVCRASASCLGGQEPVEVEYSAVRCGGVLIEVGKPRKKCRGTQSNEKIAELVTEPGHPT